MCLDEFLADSRTFHEKNDIERENIQKNATEYEQIKRGFSENMEDIIEAGKINLYNYVSSNEEMYVILTYICRFDVFHDNYEYVVERFFKTLLYDSFEGMMGRCINGIFLEFRFRGVT